MRLTIKKCDWLDDWYVIERAEHDDRKWFERDDPDHPNSMSLQCSSRFSDADVEGTAGEMLAIAAAIEQRCAAAFKRCAVNASGDTVYFCSPRNSRRDGECSYEEAAELAKEIRRVLREETEK